MLEVINTVGLMVKKSSALREGGLAAALVPTMGYLHEGHLALIREAAKLRSLVVVSIFVNPTQFGPGEDFERYPRDMERDCMMIREAGGQIVFAPTVESMYPDGYQTYAEVDELSKYLCGITRPGHFRGVATVVLKLFNIIRPEVAVFGEKDYQQLIIIKRMVKDLNLDVEIVGHPIIREPDGLAMSSRNNYLSKKDRQRALCLYGALQAGREAITAGERDAGQVRKVMKIVVERTVGTLVDYISVVDAETLRSVDRLDGDTLLALAVKIGGTRLIDNMVVTAHND